MRCYFRNGVYCYYTLAELISISSLFISISIYIIMTHKKHKIKNLLAILSIYLFYLIADHESGLVKHGLYNFIAFILITIVFLSIIFYIHFLVYLLIK